MQYIYIYRRPSLHVVFISVTLLVFLYVNSLYASIFLKSLSLAYNEVHPYLIFKVILDLLIWRLFYLKISLSEFDCIIFTRCKLFSSNCYTSLHTTAGYLPSLPRCPKKKWFWQLYMKPLLKIVLHIMFKPEKNDLPSTQKILFKITKNCVRLRVSILNVPFPKTEGFYTCLNNSNAIT